MGHISKAIRWAKQEFFHILPVFVFFFFAFNFIDGIEGLFLKTSGWGPFTFLEVLVAAGVIAKILLVVDHFSLLNLFSSRPLIYTVLWKTVFYEAITMAVRISIHLAPFLWMDKSLPRAYQDFVNAFDLTRFLAIQCLYLVLFFVFVAARELIEAIGASKVRKLFFGEKKD